MFNAHFETMHICSTAFEDVRVVLVSVQVHVLFVFGNLLLKVYFTHIHC